jgi:hypothetical protein
MAGMDFDSLQKASLRADHRTLNGDTTFENGNDVFNVEEAHLAISCRG